MRAREEAGLSQKQLAARLGISLWALDRLEHDRVKLPVDLHAISSALGKPESWFTEEGPERDGDAARTDARIGHLPADSPDGRSGSGERQDSTGEARDVEPATGPGRGHWLVLASISLLVLVRFFTEGVEVLPGAVKFIDVPVFVALLLAAALRTPQPDDRGPGGVRFLVPAVLFLVVCVVSVLANLSQVALGPVLVFLYGFLGPLVVYYAVYRLWPVGRALVFSRVLIGLGLVQLLVVLTYNLPRFLATDNPDVISGTFGENPYQLVFFLLVFATVLAGVFTLERYRAIAKLAPVLFILILATIFLAQYRALLLTAALTVLGVGALLSSARGRRGARGALAGVLIAVSFMGGLVYVGQAFPDLKIAVAIADVTGDPGFYVEERLRPFKDLPNVYGDEPRFAVTGTGAGTYSSRAWRTFYLGERQNDAAVSKYAELVNGGRSYQTDVSDKYVVPQLDGVAVQGSFLISAPYSSYSALAAEVGLLGLAAMVAILVLGLVHAGRMTLRAIAERRPRDPLPALLLGSTAAFFILLQMAFLDNWLEVTRLSFLTWALLAVATKEFDARPRGARA